MRRYPVPVRLALALTFAALRALAHPGDEQALAALDASIAKAPGQGELRLLRAAHRAAHADWAGAEADLGQAAALAPGSVRVELAWGRLCLARGQDAQARQHLDRVLALAPDHAEAYILRARASAAFGTAETARAYADYSAALRLLAEPSPSLFLERAALPVDASIALAGLDEGLARLGPAVSLLERALALELQLGHTDAALARLDALAAAGERRETFLKRRGDLLAAAGRPAEARPAYLAALAAFRALPAWLRAAPESAAFEAQLQRLLHDLSQ